MNYLGTLQLLSLANLGFSHKFPSGNITINNQIAISNTKECLGLINSWFSWSSDFFLMSYLPKKKTSKTETDGEAYSDIQPALIA